MNELTDKATARPWQHFPESTVIFGQDKLLIAATAPSDNHISYRKAPENVANAELIVQAVNEREALLAVAVAAEQFRAFYFDDLAKSNPGFLGRLVVQDFAAMNTTYISLNQSLANLAAVRKGKPSGDCPCERAGETTHRTDCLYHPSTARKGKE